MQLTLRRVYTVSVMSLSKRKISKGRRNHQSRLALSSKFFIRSSNHRRRFGKLTFRMLVLRHSEFSCFTLPLKQHHSFFKRYKFVTVTSPT